MMFTGRFFKKLLFLVVSMLPLTVQSDNTFNFHNQSKDSPVTVVVFAKPDTLLSSYKEIARGNVNPTDRLSLELPQDQIKVKYDVYFPAISPVTREGSSAEGGSIVRRQRTSVAGVIDITHEKPILVGKVKFEKNKLNQVLSLGINEKSLGVDTDSSVAVAAPAKPLVREETKVARARSAGRSVGAGVDCVAASSPKKPAATLMTKSAPKIPRWSALSTNPSQAKKEADRKRAAQRKAAQAAATAQQTAASAQQVATAAPRPQVGAGAQQTAVQQDNEYTRERGDNMTRRAYAALLEREARERRAAKTGQQEAPKQE